ncbi:MAG TPA: hypothetical protein VFY28_02775 [Candidatus Paceibacterota bacterium]|nr:hypothetical protein [Candidatus Paceibacterota bacterium]
MTLATHGIIGAAAAAIAPTVPPLAFVLAFASHFLIDSLPHRDYQLASIDEKDDKLQTDMRMGKVFAYDLLRTGTDAFIGLVIAFIIFNQWLFHVPPEIVMLGVIGGLLPDFLQLVYFLTKHRLLLPLQRFHNWIQEGKSRPEWPLWFGLCVQAALILLVVSVEWAVLL